MRLGVLSGGAGDDWRLTLEKIKVLDDLGIEIVSVGESWGRSAIPWLATLATNTSKITVGTSILNVFSRTPAAIAQDFAMLEELSGGRMLLGLGSSGQYLVEQYHGVPFDRPLQRLREYVEIFDRLIAGEPCDYDGEVFQLGGGFKIQYNRPRTKVPLLIAAISPKSIHQAGEVSDGVIPIHWPVHLFKQLRDDLEAGARDAGRPGHAFQINPHMHVDILDGSEDDAAKWREARRQIQHYINRMGTVYAHMLERNGYEDEVHASQAAWAARDAEASIAAISDEMVRAAQCIGSLDEVREQLKERAAVVDIQMLYMPHTDDPREVGRWFEALMK